METSYIFNENEYLNIDNSVELDKSYIESFILSDYLTEEDSKVIDIDNIATFFTSKYGKLISNADKTIREKSMSIIKPASSLGINNTNDDVLVRCIADLIVEKDGKYYLFAYTTDKIKNPDDANEISDRVNAHKNQLVIYAEAFNKIYKKPIEDIVLIFLDAGIACTVK